MTRIGLPKLWTPEAEGSVGGPVRFTARLSEARPWTVEVKDAAGTVVASGSGSGTAVDWTWDASARPIASYTYTISAGPNVRPSTLPVPGPPPLAITGLRASPRVRDAERRLERRAHHRAVPSQPPRRLGVRVVSASTGNSVRTLLASSERPAGRRSLSWDGRNVGRRGRCRTAATGSRSPRRPAWSRSPARCGSSSTGRSAVSSPHPRVFSPNGDGRADALEIGYELTRAATVRVQIRRGGEVLRTRADRRRGR